jgi:hypothetical protein
MSRFVCSRWRSLAGFAILCALMSLAWPATDRGQLAAGETGTEKFPAELVEFVPGPHNPVFAAEPGHWDAKIRERGWILREGETYHLWYTGYDGSRDGIRQLGYATSSDGLHWIRSPENPLCRGHWVEDMMVAKLGDTYYMFAEGLHDRAQWLTSQDRVHWERRGTLDIRMTDAKPIASGPFGTPTAFHENDTWHLFYERLDLGVWLAKSDDLKVWINVQDEPVIRPGPGEYDKQLIALNQVIKYRGQYFAYYHGSGDEKAPRRWTTDVARSSDLIHWEKFSANPIVEGDESSGIVVFDGSQYRLYTMHDRVDVYFPRTN